MLRTTHQTDILPVGEIPREPPGLARPGLARPGLARPGLARPGLARPGLAFFKEIRKSRANRVFDSPEHAFVAGEQFIKQWQPQTEQLIQLTLFSYIRNTQFLS